jgi:hypothetical protein
VYAAFALLALINHFTFLNSYVQFDVCEECRVNVLYSEHPELITSNEEVYQIFVSILKFLFLIFLYFIAIFDTIQRKISEIMVRKLFLFFVRSFFHYYLYFFQLTIIFGSLISKDLFEYSLH